jgi:hypothetical protein
MGFLVCALFVWLISHQPAVLFSQNKPAISNQQIVLFSQNKPAPAISHQFWFGVINRPFFYQTEPVRPVTTVFQLVENGFLILGASRPQASLHLYNLLPTWGTQIYSRPRDAFREFDF